MTVRETEEWKPCRYCGEPIAWVDGDPEITINPTRPEAYRAAVEAAYHIKNHRRLREPEENQQ